MNRFSCVMSVVLVAVAIGCDDPAPPPKRPARVRGAAARTTTQTVMPSGLPAPRRASLPPKVARRVDTDGATLVTLDNGLTVIIKPVRTSPIVCVKSYVHTGAMYEGRWRGSGLSHLAEHLVAEDASHDGAKGKEGDNRVTEIGGQSNASTSSSWTQYYICAASSKTDACIDLIADWMARPRITFPAFQREHGVVQRELEMRADDPGRQLWRTHAAAAFRGHPAAIPVIGYKSALAALTYQDVLSYVSSRYVPQNMIFCIVGDVDVEDVLAKTQTAFAGFGGGRYVDHTLPDVRPLAGVLRDVVTHKDVKQTTQMLAFQTIDLLHEDLYALDVLSYVLTEGDASRLPQVLRRQKKLVTGIDSWSWTPSWGKGQFGFSFRCQPDKADAAEAALLAELKRVMDAGVTADQIARAKRQKIADYVYSQQTIESIADTLATDYLSTGDVTFSRNYTDRIQAVTAAQVHAMARKYFTLDRMVITRQNPPSPAGTTAAATRPAGRAAKATVFTLPDGTDVVLQPSDAVALVAMAYVVEGGVMVETDKTNGLGTMMTSLSTEGAGNRSAKEIAAFFDAAGGGIGGACGNNSFYWQATVLDDSFGAALGIFADVIRRPQFKPSELDILRPNLVDAVKSIDEQWESQLSRYWRETFFRGGPYGRLAVGKLGVVETATARDVRDYHRKWILGRKGVLTVYGQFDPAKARGRIEKAFAAAAGQTPGAKMPAPSPPSAPKLLNVLKTDNQVAGMIVSVPGMVRDDDDRFAITVLDTIISGYRLPSGWLHEELRGKRLVYAVHAYNIAWREPGAFCVHAACQPEKAGQVLEIIRKNLARAAQYTPTQAEVDRAVNVILTAKLLGSQEISELALNAALNQLYGFGYDYRSRLEAHYRKVTPADVRRVAEKYLTRPLVVVITTPKPEAVQPATQPAGDAPRNGD